MLLRIGEFSRRGRVSVKALRHYESVGLLKPAHVDGATGYRYYEPRQLDALHSSMVLRARGLSPERIRDLLQDDPSPESPPFARSATATSTPRRRRSAPSSTSVAWSAQAGCSRSTPWR